MTIIKALLREGHVDFEGYYYQARDCELRPRGPRPNSIPIVVGAQGKRMLRLTARHADAWNRDLNPAGSIAELPEWHAKVDAACHDVGRDPTTLARYAAISLDLPGAPPIDNATTIKGSPEELAEALRAYAARGISHVQVWLELATVAGIEAFAPTLELLDREG